MSLEARLKQGLTSLSDPIDVDYELGLVRVQAVARQRERRHVMIAAFAGAAAAIALLAGGGKLADMVLGLEVPLPPAEERNTDEELDRGEIDLDRRQGDDELVRDDTRIDDALNQSEPEPADGAGFDSAGRPNGRSGYAPPTNATDSSSDFGQQQEQENSQPGTRDRRTATGRYAGSAVPVGGGQSACDEGRADSVGCVTFQTEPGERSVSIAISDANELHENSGPVAAWVQIDRDGDGKVDGESTPICGTGGGIKIPPSGDAVVYVEIDGGACQSGTDSNPSSGTVTAVFAR